jgi:peroxiredoxin
VNKLIEADIEVKPAKDFAANDSEGRLIKLSDFKERKNVVLVFNRGFT